MPKLVMIAIVAVSLLGCQPVSEPEGDRTQPNATETAEAGDRQYLCSDHVSKNLTVDMVRVYLPSLSQNCGVWESDPLGCTDELAAIRAGTDRISGLARMTMELIRARQDLECPRDETAIDIAATYTAVNFLLGQPNVPETLKRQLLPATKRWIASADPAVRSEALDEMAMLASLYRAANPAQVIIFTVRTNSTEVAPVESDSKVWNTEWRIQDLERDVNRLNEELNP